MSDSTKTIMPLGAAAQQDNDPHRHDYIRPDQYDRPIVSKLSAAEIRATGLVIGGLGAGLLALLSIIRWLSCWGQSFDLTRGCMAASVLFWGYVSFVVVLAIAGALILLWGRVARIQAETARANITRDRYSNPVSVAAVHDLTLQQAAAFFASAQQAEIAMAPYKMLPAGLDVYNQGSAPAEKLPVPVADAPALIADAEWLKWIDSMPHLLIAGRTNAGKTTLARAVLSERAKGREQLLILDPHDQPGKWSVAAIGGGRDFAAILDALAGVLSEMDRRFKAYDRGQATEDFDRLTVLIDEVPALVASTMDGTKTLDPRWRSFARKLGSEARKVRICALLLTQSPLVQDIQINSYMRENFTRVALGDQAPSLLSEEKDTKRRGALLDLLRGRTHAAAMEYQGEIHVLNTDGIPQRAEQKGRAQLWMPERTTPTLGMVGRPPMPQSVAQKSRQAQIAWLGGAGYTTREIQTLLGGDYNEIVQYARMGRMAVGRP